MLNNALALSKAGKIAEAEALYDKILASKPRSIAVQRAFIHFHNRYSRKFRRALPVADGLMQQRPKSAEPFVLAAETYINCARVHLGLGFANDALARAPENPDALFIAAVANMGVNRFETAAAQLDLALAVRPDHFPSRLQKIRALLAHGDAPAASEACRALLADHPGNLNVIELWVNATPATADDPVYLALEELVVRYEDRGRESLATVLKLQGKCKEDMGQHDAALALFTRARAVSPVKHDRKAYSDFVSTLSANIAPADLTGEHDSDRPVLIVGMPRSGSTLLEHILAGHPQIASAGESTSLNIITQDTGIGKHDARLMVQAIRQIPSEAQARLARRYLDETTPQRDVSRVIDKSMHNFELLGFFAKLLPRARIIHIRRDPLDTCTSCYMQRLSAWHSYTQDFQSLGQSYLDYDRLMAHWAKVLPNPMMDITYEAMIDDTETAARRLIAFLGLDWDPACLDFQNAGNQSQTLSSWQVRQPIYTTSMQRWKRYGDAIAPLQDVLKPLYPNGFDGSA